MLDHLQILIEDFYFHIYLIMIILLRLSASLSAAESPCSVLLNYFF
ncbi:hypothetical protein SAMN05216283_101563 [Sunxiuqinia elliptica]|uniref:Uncharacterized protein n=1 Tax=Sunxiuqinia elliptica TaxID=655355 RepID=A0A1I2C0Q4_9BACT|nr:hypothetical protein SAMN05216283_101563 [Sunxiuqinia elliptica]